MVLSMNEWMTEPGYEPFAYVVEVSPQRYQLKLLTDADGVPCTPEVAAVVGQGRAVEVAVRAAVEVRRHSSSGLSGSRRC